MVGSRVGFIFWNEVVAREFDRHFAIVGRASDSSLHLDGLYVEVEVADCEQQLRLDRHFHLSAENGSRLGGAVLPDNLVAGLVGSLLPILQKYNNE